jgi:hypothetical protein
VLIFFQAVLSLNAYYYDKIVLNDLQETIRTDRVKIYEIHGDLNCLNSPDNIVGIVRSRTQATEFSFFNCLLR